MVIARPMLTRLRGRKNTSGRSEPKIATSTRRARSRLRFWAPTRPTRRGEAAPGRGGPGRLGGDHAASLRLLAHGERQERLLGGRGRRQLADDPALAHHGDPVGEAEQLGHLGGDHQDGDAGGGELLDQAVDLELGADVDAAGRLVQDQDARLAGEPAGEHHLLLVAARELADLLLDGGRLDARAGRRAPDQPALAPAVEEAQRARPAPARRARRCPARCAGAGAPPACGPRARGRCRPGWRRPGRAGGRAGRAPAPRPRAGGPRRRSRAPARSARRRRARPGPGPRPRGA